MDSYPMDKLYAKLSEQHSLMQQQEAQKSSDDEARYTPPSSSLPITPAAEEIPTPTVLTARSASATPDEGQGTSDEILRLKLELAQAQTKISRLDQELAQTRLVKLESGRSTPALVADPDFLPAPIGSPVASRVSNVAPLGIPPKMPLIREHNWMPQDDTRSDTGDSLSTGGFNRARGIWNNNKPAFSNPYPQNQMMGDGPQSVPWPNTRTMNTSYEPTFAPSGMDMYRQDRMVPDHEVMRPMGRRGNRYDNRYASSNNFGGGFNGYNNMGAGQYEPAGGYSTGPQGAMAGSMGMGLYPPYQEQPVGTALSPHATEFTATGAPWKTEVSKINCLDNRSHC